MIDIDKLTEGFDFSGYESPVKMFQEQIRIDVENDIMKAVRKVGVLVDKEELIKALKNDREQYIKGYMDGLNANKWIPVSERLPKRGEQVMVCNRYGSVFVSAITYMNAKVFSTGECHDFGKHYGVVAWQPLPAPYDMRKKVRNDGY